jgi:hypothetical protein
MVTGGTYSTKEISGKAGVMKRKTHRQKVLSVYPDAHLYNGYDVIIRVLDSPGSNGRPDLYRRFWLSMDKYNARDAWKDAWLTVQEMMIAKLES